MEKTLEYESFLSHMPFPVTLEISSYLNNGNLYIGLVDVSEEYPEPYGDVTVNIGHAPSYCGYLDLNNMPELEEFIKKNDLGEFTGIMQRSGFCEYPLYLFNVDKLRELAPEGMAKYEEMINGPQKKAEPQKAR